MTKEELQVKPVKIINAEKSRKLGEFLKASRIKEFLEYRSDGCFYWTNACHRHVLHGQKAGYTSKLRGYKYIRFMGRNILVHRLAWFFVYDEYPDMFIDHINNDPFDNRIENLRKVTARQSSQNLKIHKKGKLVGAQYSKREKHWYAKISINRKQRTLGRFKTAQDAHECYLKYIKDNNL